MTRRRLLVTAGVVALAAPGAWYLFGGAVAATLPGLVGWVERMGPLGPLLFVAGYAVATVALVPGSLLTLAAGAIFGLVRGTVYVLAGATTGAFAAFLVSRYLARPIVERSLASNSRVERIDRAVSGHGFKVVLLLRLSPALPFVLLNYALGLTRVRAADYLLASVGMLPGTLLYVYYGKVAGDVAVAVVGEGTPRGAPYYIVLALGLAATIAVTVLITRIARRALEEETENGSVSAAG